MQVSAKELAEKMRIDNVQANTLLRVLEAKGHAKIVDVRKPPSGKGRGTNIYEVEETVTLNLTE